MTSSAVNNAAAIAAAISGIDENLLGAPLRPNPRAAAMKNGSSREVENLSSGKEASSVTASRPVDNPLSHEEDLIGENEYPGEGSAIIDGHASFGNNGASNARTRRASEGAHLSKSEGKRSSGELRCEKCGKGYKHSSCLTKHLLVHPNLKTVHAHP